MIPADVRERPKVYGAGLIALGFVLLVVLRFWASPIARRIGGHEVDVVAFLGIPLFLGLLALGIAVFLWEPEGER